MKYCPSAIAALLGSVTLLHAAPPTKLELKTGDHIALVGNSLADRMQHDAYFESMVYQAFSKDELTFRNLGFSGDEITVRDRAEGFGTPDEWLEKTKADVVLAFFGFNESFGGPDGLEKFKSNLDKWIDDTRKQNYSGHGAPQIVLFSPIAEEALPDPNYPDPAANNAHLQLYAAAMADVAKENDVQFIDLFAPSLQLYKEAATPLTFNGIHLTEAGYRALAPIMFKAIFGADAPPIDPALEKIRAAVVEKNEMWFSRYRTVDGYNVYGGRSKLSFQSGKNGPKITNYQVMQEEMSVRDVMTANRDKRVWAVAQGSDLTVDDSNVPPIEQVATNHPGSNPDGSHPFLGAEEAIRHMTVPKGCRVNLFASEEQFPELIKPVQMAWDTKGRLWVSAWRSYPERTPSDRQGDSILILEDTDGDGKADKVTHFIDGLNCPTGFQFYKDGILLMQAPDLWYVRDTDGDGKADWKERVLDGIDSADSHHTTNSMVLDPGGATYLSDGVFHRSQVETASGVVRNTDAAIYRFEPRTGKFERYAAYGFANPHGRVFDYWGNDLITDGTGNANYFGPAISGHIDYPAKHPAIKQFWNRPSRPCPGTGILSSRAFPEEFNNNFLNCNVIGIQGIFRVKVTEDGSGLAGQSMENLVTSDDPNFRPCAVNVGPDGAVYFADWSNAIIGHMQHHIRDPNRDHTHGRIYRMTFDGRPLLKRASIDGQPVEALLELLKEPENDVRMRAKIELGKHPSSEVMAATSRWVASLDKNDPAYEHQLTEALWVHQWHNVVDTDLLSRVLRSPDPHARTAATRVLCYWRDRVPGALAFLKTQAEDDSPRVRLEAVRAASFFNGPDVKEAMAVACNAIRQPTDYYIDYTFRETLKQLQSLSVGPSLPDDPYVATYVIEHMSDRDLANAPNVEPVLLMRLERRATSLTQRCEALKDLSRLHQRDQASEFVSVLRILDEKGKESSEVAIDLAQVIGSILTDDLVKSRGLFVDLAATGVQASVRRCAWAAAATADANPPATWTAAKTDAARRDLIDSIGLLNDPGLRGQFQPQLQAILADGNTSPATDTAALRALPLMGSGNAKANFAILAARVGTDVDRAVSARAIMQLPRNSWDVGAAAAIAQSIYAWAKTVPAGQRTSDEFVETVQTAMEMAGLLPSAQASPLRKELRGLGVSVFAIKTVREQMRYDTPRIVVEAGKPFEVTIENLDFMNHNIVFVRPGARQAVAESVQTMRPDQLDKLGRAYVPAKDKRVLGASRLLEPGEKQRLQLVAPTQPGEYEYLCTYPGHWMVMWGKLIVTKDVDGYLQANP